MSDKLRVLSLYGRVFCNKHRDKHHCLLRGRSLDANRQHQFWGMADAKTNAVTEVYDDLYDTLWSEVSSI